jgi:putative transcriptional regulator
VTTHAGAYQALMLDHAAGALTTARRLLIETHLRLKPEARGYVGRLDIAGGALLESLEPSSLAATPLAPAESAAATRAPVADNIFEARALIAAAAGQPDNLRWRWRAPALRELRLPVPGASLVRMGGGRAVPTHGHTGEELTLVLRGKYADETGAYGCGEIAFADPEFDHSPYVPEGGDCVCLVVTDGGLKFHGAIARLVHRVLS